MHQTASECQLQISLAMQRNRCTRHLDHKSLGWEKLMKIMRGHSKPNYPAEGSLLWFSIHLTSDYTVMFTSFTHPESSWIARQYSAPHAKHCWQSLQRRQPRIANSTAIRYLSPADLVEKVKKLWSIRISKDCFQQRYYIYIYMYQYCFLMFPLICEPCGTSSASWAKVLTSVSRNGEKAMPPCPWIYKKRSKKLLARVATWNRPKDRIYFMRERLAICTFLNVNNANCSYLVSQRSGA